MGVIIFLGRKGNEKTAIFFDDDDDTDSPKGYQQISFWFFTFSLRDPSKFSSLSSPPPHTHTHTHVPNPGTCYPG